MYEQHLKQQITNIFQAGVPLLPGASQHHRAGQPTQRLGANLSLSGDINSLNQVGWLSGRHNFRTDRRTITDDAAHPGTVGRDDRGDERRLPRLSIAGILRARFVWTRTVLHSIYKHETFRHAISGSLKRQVVRRFDIRARPVMVLLIGRAAVCNERSEDAE